MTQQVGRTPPLPAKQADPPGSNHDAGPIAKPAAEAGHGRSRRRSGLVFWQNRWMYLFVIPGVAYFLIFVYLPLAGNVVAFKDYSPYLGIGQSPWVGMQNFQALFENPQTVVALRNTLVLTLLQLVFAFPAPILLSLLLNSLISERVKRFIQSVVYLPHFFGWVIVISIWMAVFGGTGPVSQIVADLGFGQINLMSDPALFKALVTSQVIWKEVGWSTIVFFAAISTIPTELYESAAADGAGAWRRIWHVTLPGITGVIILLFILRLGNVMTVGFEQLLLQRNAVGADAAEVLDTYVYFQGILGGQWGVAAAAGLFKGVIGTVLVIGSNRIAKRMGQGGLF